jgi:sensor c-di-GMP phosphodiesterase-like protein
MTTVALEHHRVDAKLIIRASMERMISVDAYTDEGQRIVGKQEASVMGGNGARLIVDVPEMQETDDQTVVEVTAEKEIAIDVVTNPEDMKSEFLDSVNDLRQKDVDMIREKMNQHISPAESKQVASSGTFEDTQSTIGKRFIITLVVAILFSLMITAMILP